MSIFKTGLLLVAMALLTVPWWFSEHSEVLGLPLWALYSLIASVVVVALVAMFSNRIWNIMSGEDHE